MKKTAKSCWKILVPLMTVILLTGLVSCSACGDDASSDDTGKDDPTPEPDDDDDDDSGQGDDDEEITLDITLTLEYRNTLSMRLVTKGSSLNATLWTHEGYGDDLLAAGNELEATGKILRFPESSYEILTLEFSGPPVPAGPCGPSVMSYRLTLGGQVGAAEKMGGIAVHCNNAGTGRPERFLRILATFPTAPWMARRISWTS